MKASPNFLHHQTTDWLRELDFYKEEITILKKRLEEVASKNTASEVLAMVDHFENKLIMTNEQMDIFRHDIKAYQNEVYDLAKDKPEHINEKFAKANDTLKDRAGELAKSVSDTRFELNKFLSRTL